ncbi:hypothetical protein RSOLAG22IIIB_07482 [Rhizoctonia solani]|uniref:Uncharacterized protein n=1 Tax=Rhizoctonia solani TaxID=456999 RepID=A0A0K6FN07_9AGAM|nr:hypothetical protein RSOLAG22IIIB_07482 [Rhizoctonia solani]
MKTVNKVLVGIQHAIIRNHKGNTATAVDCLVNEQGETPGMGGILQTNFKYFSGLEHYRNAAYRLPVVIDGAARDLYIHNAWLADSLYFYGLSKDLCKDATGTLQEGKEGTARIRLGDYLSSCLGWLQVVGIWFLTRLLTTIAHCNPEDFTSPVSPRVKSLPKCY